MEKRRSRAEQGGGGSGHRLTKPRRAAASGQIRMVIYMPRYVKEMPLKKGAEAWEMNDENLRERGRKQTPSAKKKKSRR